MGRTFAILAVVIFAIGLVLGLVMKGLDAEALLLFVLGGLTALALSVVIE